MTGEPIIEISTQLPVGLPHPTKRELTVLARHVWRGEGGLPGRIGIILCGDELLRDLNKRYRNLNRTTDVLSFPSGDVLPDGVLDHGEIYISLPQAYKQSARECVHPKEEVYRLVIHGLMHLLGYEHHTMAERAIMRNQENRWFLPIPPPRKKKSAAGEL